MIDRVSALIREVASEAILPRFGRLGVGDILEKSPGEEVTAADEEAERLLTIGLSSLLPGSAVIGEEAVAKRPELLNVLGQGRVWLVDPLDGTSNFVTGSTCFSTMVTLVKDGEAVTSWMFSPVTGALHVAERGAGASIGGTPVQSPPPPVWSELRGSVLTRFLPGDLRDRILERSRGCRVILPGLCCAGEEYPAVVRGVQNFAVFWRALPWDHAPGVLFLQEAGGKAARFDGSSYRPAEPGYGILAAQTPGLWRDLHEMLLGPAGRPML